ncbi:caspase family protein [Epibacterium ulvae]|uniref:caspase family protein n=1 Tax=Epibacterium ulvae TaxID=1156985 RepID=UPI0020419A97|nr:caspase family protein [Epibacterium ulvae]
MSTVTRYTAPAALSLWLGALPLHALTLVEIKEETAPQNIAVVIGIQSYDHIQDLNNTRHDAESVAKMLREFGYSVFDGYDLDKRGVEQLLRAAALNIRSQDQLFFYYAGHGVQMGRRNYLLTSDAALRDIHDLPFQSITLDQVSAILGGKAAQQILMLDSCRENPVPNAKVTAELGAELYEAREGFDVFRPPLNTLVAFSTSPGDTALDGEPGENSPYTAAVLRQFPERTNEDAMSVLTRIRQDVLTATADRQLPWESSTLTNKAYVRPIASIAPTPLPQSAPEPQVLPDRLAINVPLGRALELAGELRPYMSGDIDASLVQAPSNGLSTVGATDDGHFSLIYRPNLQDRSATDGKRPLTDQFTIRVAQAGGARDVTVDLNLTPSECDHLAGDLLDLQGVGLHRFPNEIDLPAAETACRAAIEQQPDIGRFHYQLGRALQGQGRLEEAYVAFDTARRLDHIRANNALAFLHVSPTVDRATVDIPFDQERATTYWEKGASSGDPFSMHALGKRLLRDEDSATSARGFDLLSRALELGHTYSMNELGVYYLWSKSNPQPERGLSYLEASAERGDIFGIANLAYAHRDGLAGLNASPQKAFDLFEAATDGGHPYAPAEIGRLIMAENFPGKGPAEALKWYDIGLSRGDGWSGANGAWIALNPLSGSTPTAEAIARAGKALALPNADARAAARNHISRQSAREIDAGTQFILKSLGADITVDGQFGPASRRALDAIAATTDIKDTPPSNPIERLKFAARLHFARNPIRQDLF